jgi:hypothetical protein
MGPTEPDEILAEFPTNRYLVGRLAPARSGEGDHEAEIPFEENDTLVAGSTDDEDGAYDPPPPLTIGFSPSSFGLSFLVAAEIETLRAEISWGDYRSEQNEGKRAVWRRCPNEALIEGISIRERGSIPRIPLSSIEAQKNGVSVVGADAPEIFLEGVVHVFAGYRAVSLFLVNRRSEGQMPDRTKDGRWIFQPRIRIMAGDGSPAFVAKDSAPALTYRSGDEDLVAAQLLYRHAREFATGHGVAAEWDDPVGDGRRTTAVFTEFIPSYEVPLLIAPTIQTGSANLDMRDLARAQSGREVVELLEPMVTAYETWIDRIEREVSLFSDEMDADLIRSAKENIRQCETCVSRIRASLGLLAQDQRVFEAFRFANRVMWDQRIHSIWAATNRRLGEVKGLARDEDKPGNRTWRPFQMGFILLNILGVADEESDDRRLVDLLWFPTGGGKTEAYLGLAAFTMALRRLRGDRHSMSAEGGVSIIMRYTLRLLTLQQFQRATALIAACEIERKSAPEKWGREPFQIGVWVGRGTTPNTFMESSSALENLRAGKRLKEGSPVQLVSCPRCGAMLVSEKGFPRENTYLADRTYLRTRIYCPNSSCEFSPQASAPSGLPVVVVDDEIYRVSPTMVVATVDKFARLPFKGEAGALFGLRDRYSPTYGNLTEAHGDTVGGRRVRDAVQVPRLLPPELIIQDELHLISGPLGTMVGLYEAVVDYASALHQDNGVTLPAKVIASTATIRRASQQVKNLYARPLSIFPPSGISSKDSFFANELAIGRESDSKSGRLYVGVNAPGSSTKTLLVRVYAVLLAAAKAELDRDPGAADPYGTLVGYFNSLRALGGAKRLVEDDVAARLKYLAQQRGFLRRYVDNHEELTSRVESWKIPSLLKKLDNTFPREKADWPVDVLLATNMISVGVDIDRLGLMVVTGQPKSTAEYIQATSRVGRKFPGLVVTMYNWLGARDLSHYERFRSYHSALYRYVEAISVTPFSSRALDRGLRGVFSAMNRLVGASMSREEQAGNFDSTSNVTVAMRDEIVRRAKLIAGDADSALVEERLIRCSDEWSRLAEELLRYSWLDDTQKPPNNARVLLRTAGTQNEGEWPVPGSLREVEATAAFYLVDLEDS